jgi:Raf kinase inhibitor-like YbhB/YbcL family protein
MKKTIFLFVICLFFCLAFAESKFSASTASFDIGGKIHKKFAFYGADGENISPEIKWKNPPKDTKSFVIVCIDTNPIAKKWVHWMVLNIPGETRKIQEGEDPPKGSSILLNSFRKPGYGGPQPPPGSGIHKYVFTVYALNVPRINTKNKFLSEAQLLKLLKGKILEKASFYGTYKR